MDLLSKRRNPEEIRRPKLLRAQSLESSSAIESRVQSRFKSVSGKTPFKIRSS